MDKQTVLELKDLNVDILMALLGENDSNLKTIGQYFGTELTLEEDRLVCPDEEKVKGISEVLQELLTLYRMKKGLEKEDVTSVLVNKASASFFRKEIATGSGNRRFYLRSRGQKELYEAFENHIITIVTGPAGTGKTFLSVVYASNLLKKGAIRKIIITRPVVEAGESLGFLPGDLKEKVDPYLKPIYDSLEMIFGMGNTDKLLEKGVVEIAPLAYMRGRTLNDACVILDEAQNTTEMQIKMFLTRLGFNSRMIITGDITQIDLPNNKPSGLVRIREIVGNIDEIAFIETSSRDVVRHPVVQKIIDAYEKAGK